MAWYIRPCGRYYYQSVRIGKQVTKRDIGTGPLAEFVAEKDAEARAARFAAAKASESLKVYLSELDGLIEQHRQLVDVVVSGVMLPAGFHQPRNQAIWTRRYGRRKLKAG